MRKTSAACALGFALVLVPAAAAVIASVVACGAGPMESPPASAASGSAAPPASVDIAANPPSGSASASASAALPPELPPPPAPAEWKVTLLSPGDEPRKPLRYSFHAGSKESASMDMRMALSLTLDKNKKDVQTAPVAMTVTLTQKSVLPNGNLDYGFTLDAIDIPSKDADPRAKAVLQQLVGTTGEMEVTAQGKTEKGAVTSAPGAADQIGDITEQLVGALRDMMVPLPAEPVGKGAKWQVTGPFPVKPVVAVRTTTCTLTKIAGTKGTIDAIEEVNGPPQSLQTPGGQRADLQSMKGSGTRSASFDLTKLAPTSTWSLTADSVQTVYQPDGPHSVQAHSEITLNLGPKK